MRVGERRDVRGLAAIFAGGFAGAILRVGLAESVAADPAHWPWATFIANVAGALVLGYVAERVRDPRRRLLLATGFCGALTTFSTLQLELLWMLDAASYELAGAYALASVAAGLLAVAMGRGLARGARGVPSRQRGRGA
jgi:CrcB protein